MPRRKGGSDSGRDRMDFSDAPIYKMFGASPSMMERPRWRRLPLLPGVRHGGSYRKSAIGATDRPEEGGTQVGISSATGRRGGKRRNTTPPGGCVSDPTPRGPDSDPTT